MIINNLSNLSVFESEVALFTLPQNSQFYLPKSKIKPLEILLKSNILCTEYMMKTKQNYMKKAKYLCLITWKEIVLKNGKTDSQESYHETFPT